MIGTVTDCPLTYPRASSAEIEYVTFTAWETEPGFGAISYCTLFIVGRSYPCSRTKPMKGETGVLVTELGASLHANNPNDKMTTQI